jgi:hypothetical protein
MALGAIRDDLVSLLAIVVGKDQARKKVGDLEAMIRGEAQSGAEKAIPEIRKQVREEALATLSPIKPWIIAALVVGSLALLTTAGTVLYVRKKAVKA